MSGDETLLLGHIARYLNFSSCEMGPMSFISHRDDTIFFIEKDLLWVVRKQLATQAEGPEFGSPNLLKGGSESVYWRSSQESPWKSMGQLALYV